MCEYSSQDITELAKALIAVQQQLHPAFKDSDNPFTKSRYASLNSVMQSCRDALIRNGIWLTQYPVPAEPGCLGLVTKLTHAESGQWQSSLAVVPLPKADPQGVGISMTYMRRYALSAMLAIVTEEDTDGEWVKNQPKQVIPAKRAVNAHVSQKDPQHRESQAEKISGTSNGPTEGFENLPKLSGVSYQLVKSSGQPYIVASGDTVRHKSLLAEAGFRWSAQRKVWWMYANVS